METEYEIEIHGYNQAFQLSHNKILRFSTAGHDLDPRVRAGATTMAIAWAKKNVPGFGSTVAQTAMVLSAVPNTIA